jgi:hypothetical protein
VLILFLPQVGRCSQPLIVRCRMASSWLVADKLLTSHTMPALHQAEAGGTPLTGRG